ncbi:class I SAM-dependent methyltransferase [Sporosalibacterium faouarense]|uniref:class I SAM-dependent methyltransferase n=1 Tax=Sporosalibacterium faouarense TaxID=516123 RepID=UPI00141C4807|nr:SAM-dependent methyltransferase [Sporosalibacterium faouarense]MTI47047.1 SAM-dependent methyltransferase [Bacillota bacterium]
MENLRGLLEDVIMNEKIIYGVLSNLKQKNGVEFNKVSLKPVKIKSEIVIQLTYHIGKKVEHYNLSYTEGVDRLEELMIKYFKQTNLFTTEADYQIFINKKGKNKILKKKPTKEKAPLSHNKKKNYIIEEGDLCPFLIKLGIMNDEGKVYKKRYNKFRQINRYLEIVADVIPSLDSNGIINIVDFGCGKSYLTFALYHYLVNILKYNVNIVGLDLKSDVIKNCNKLSEEMNFENLKFIQGDIKNFEEFKKVNMVLTLHACDTATDDALVKAVNWDADIILSVPCCQHELLNQIHNPIMEPMMKHGIIKEKLSTLITDSIRGNILEILGYSTQIMEFIDMEHTPKNILIRAIKKKESNPKLIGEYTEFKKVWGISPYIEKAMGERLHRILQNGKEI